MCGIFGLVQNKAGNKSTKIFRHLCLLSESRGKEASGFAIKKNNCIKVYKTPLPAGEMVKSKIFRDEILENASKNQPFIAIGHSRLVTNGYEQFDVNNQPVVKNGFVVVHNGIIVNQAFLWQKYGEDKKISELDSELIPTLLSYYLKQGKNLSNAILELFSEIYGMTNFALLSDKFSNLILATNNGSIYYIIDPDNDFFVFASERFFLKMLIKKSNINYSNSNIKQLKPGYFLSVSPENFVYFQAKFGDSLKIFSYNEPIDIVILKEKEKNKNIYINKSLDHSTYEVPFEFIKVTEERLMQIQNLKRCKKCVLPETFPYISFDEKGTCNYCNNYKKQILKGEEALMELADKFRKKDGGPECLVPFSGGRDSSYALHYIVKKLGLKPIAYSYDWGMITDLARRNQARLCGKLGVEHILLSADIRKKRSNIRKNVLAWLKSPSLGTVPLFMAGDKQYFYHANRLMKQNEIKLSILGENLLETTNFKSGFCGIKPHFDREHTYSLSVKDKLKLALYYGREFLTNPSYLNSSLPDTLGAFSSYYVIKHYNINIYDYIKWDEKIILETLIREYEWETDPGTKGTWRIGDGTAAFYNFIYYMLAGFTENDTFRSNQIREGDLTREEALKLVLEENKPRWDSIQWYCRTIGIDFNSTIARIIKIKTIHEKF